MVDKLYNNQYLTNCLILYLRSSYNNEIYYTDLMSNSHVYIYPAEFLRIEMRKNWFEKLCSPKDFNIL